MTRELLPIKKLVPQIHQVKIKDERVWKKLAEIRNKEGLYDRESAIKWLLKEMDMWES